MCSVAGSLEWRRESANTSDDVAPFAGARLAGDGDFKTAIAGEPGSHNVCVEPRTCMRVKSVGAVLVGSPHRREAFGGLKGLFASKLCSHRDSVRP